MTWEQKLAACKALAFCHLEMREPGNWYVSWHAELTKHGSCLMTGKYGNGRSPQEAVDAHWHIVTGISAEEYWIAHAMTPSMRRAARWNGFMWQDVQERDSGE